MSMRNSFLSLILLTLLSSLTGCSESSFSGVSPEVEFHNTYEILGGQNVKPVDPVAAATVMLLNLESNEICTATLIARKVAITAAHCLPRETENLQVFFALNPLAEEAEVEGQAVARMSPYEGYNVAEPLRSVDLALVQFRTEAPPVYRPVKLSSEVAYKAGQSVLLAGYGNNSATQSEGFGRLRKVRVFISKMQKDFFEIDQSQGKGICDGDSGGPVFYKTGSSLSLMGVSKLVYDKKQTGAANCLTVSQFTALKSLEIRAWIQDFLQKTLADVAK